MTEKTLHEAASAMGKIGGLKGGRARALKLSSEDRVAIAARAAMARWHGEDALFATHTGVLQIAGVDLPCYVLNDGRHILSKRGVASALGMTTGGGKNRAPRVSAFLEGFAEKGLETSGICARTEEVVPFSNLGTPGVAHGIDAGVLVDLCRVFLEARRLGILTERAHHIADRCEILISGFATVGLIALIDEVTGYERDRQRDALTLILERFIARELRPWVKTFPGDFYQHIFRLRDWKFDADSVKRPGCLGYITTDLVYQRLAPGVIGELKRLTPRDDKGRLKHRLHQHLSEQAGHPKLREHLTGVVYLLKAAGSWRSFKDQLDRVAPRFGDTLLLDFGAQDRVD